MLGETQVYIGLGSNLGDRHAQCQQALERLGHCDGIKVSRVSGLLDNPPLGFADQPDYLNAVVELQTTLVPERLLAELKGIERAMGREEQGRWASRPIDLDLLLYGSQAIASAKLTVPHPQMHWRHFVMDPMAELAPLLCHPVLGDTMEVIAARLNGSSFHGRADAPRLICIAGNIGVGKTTLATHLAAALSGEALYEPYDSNPFLSRVYAGEQALALDSQLYFLANRIDQLSPDTLQSDQVYVSDYLFAQEQVYAQRLLDETQLALHQRLYSPLANHVVTPTLTLYLTDTVDGCLSRIHHRNRAYEQGIEVDFLASLDQGYDQLFADWHQSPLLRLAFTELDALNPNHIAKLAETVTPYLGLTQEPTRTR